MLEEYPDILLPEDLCEILRMGSNAVYNLLNTGKIKAFKNGRTWRISKTAVVEFIRDNSVGK